MATLAGCWPGTNSGATGFGADRLLIDDPVKDAAEADSAAHRRRVITEYRSTRLSRSRMRLAGNRSRRVGLPAR
jgi:hypothetical protein